MERQAFELLKKMESSWWYRGRAAAMRAALARAGFERVREVLDFGAGFGGMYRELALCGEAVFAFEPDAEAQRVAREHPYAAIFSTDTEALSRAYDLVGLFDVVEHIEHDDVFLKKAYLALRGGGRVAITVPAFPFLWSVHDVNHHHFRRYTKASMTSVLRSAGFEVEYASYWNMSLFIPAALMRLVGRSGEGTLTMSPWLDAVFFAVVWLESRLLRFVPLPFGTGLVVIARKASGT